ncbi:MAG: DUF885 domain-containing protein [SAR202 cluster bacterium]|nr:DUF885 domain-containing protein [SAR202 cluster bacterium]
MGGGQTSSLKVTLAFVVDEMWEFYPNLASAEGLHNYDGRMPDLSEDAWRARASQVRAGIAQLEPFDRRDVEGTLSMDLALTRAALRKELFKIEGLRSRAWNPMDMLFSIDVSNYVIRRYAPPAVRAAALTRALGRVPEVVEQMSDGLRGRVSRPILETSIEAYAGMADFYRTDLADAIGPLGAEALAAALAGAVESAARAVDGFVEILRSRLEEAPEEFALGAYSFRTLLSLGEMVDTPLESLLAEGERDLRRNLESFRRLAEQIGPGRPLADVLKEIGKDHPTKASLVSDTRAMLEEIRSFCIERDVVTVPSEDRCEVKETPRFMRWAFAAMDDAGVYETNATEAYYYVTPPEDDWPADKQEEWLTSFSYPLLKGISVHEAYPGHFTHHLHTRNIESKLGEVFGAYTFWEGWAHYTEEMMVEQGFAADDSRVRLGVLLEALLRDCRYICAIRMHTMGMTLDEATRFFMENAFIEELPARKEATRGTFDPMYLSYTLGKLQIKRLREEYRARLGDGFSLKAFHDRALSFGAPPIPLLREAMARHGSVNAQ